VPKIPASKFFPLYAHGDGTRRSYPESLPGLTINSAVRDAIERISAAASLTPAGAPGFTDLDALINSAPYASSRIVYVSTSGNDATGVIYSPASSELGGIPTNPTGTVLPYATLAGAWAQIRDGFADVMLLRRGDTWSTSLFTNKAGASATARIVVAAYGPTSTARPQVGYLFPDSSATAGRQLLAHYVCAFPSNSGVATRGFTTRFEGVLFTGPAGTPSAVLTYVIVDGLAVVRCAHSRVRLFTWETVSRAQFSFWENVLWHPPSYVDSGDFQHNNYFQFDVGDIDSRRNISVHSPGVGFRQRGLGTVEANLILGNNTARGPLSVFDIGTTTYYGTGDPGNRGTFLNFRYNLALHYPGRHSFYDIRNAVIEHNILRGEGQHLTYFENTANPGNPPPLVNATLQDNIFYGAYLIQSEGHSGSVTGPYLIRRNDFQRPAGGALINAQSNDFTYESNNRFWSSSPQADWFTGYTNSYAAYVPSRGSNTQVTYPDPDRDLVTYMQSLGYSPASAEQAIDWFTNGTSGFAGAINNRLGLWDERATARAVINHVRAGFGLGAIP
jgi:hypothetical protein